MGHGVGPIAVMLLAQHFPVVGRRVLDQAWIYFQVATPSGAIKGEVPLIAQSDSKPDVVIGSDLLGLRQAADCTQHEQDGFGCEGLAGVRGAVDDVQSVDKLKLGRRDIGASEDQVAQLQAVHGSNLAVGSSRRKSAVQRPMRLSISARISSVCMPAKRPASQRARSLSATEYGACSKSR